MKQALIYLIALCALMSGCSTYGSYQRPDCLPVDSLYRNDVVSRHESDTVSLGDLPWKEVFRDTVLQHLIDYGLSNNTDMQVALLRLDQAQARLNSAKLAYLPSLSMSAQGAVSKSEGASAVKSYQIPLQAEWEIDLFGKLRNAKKEAQATMLQQRAYCCAVRTELIAGIANGYFSLLMLDEQLKIIDNTIDLWKEQVRTMESMWKVGETTENAVTSARANLTAIEATRVELLRQQYEMENSICILLGIPSRHINRGTLEQQTVSEELCTGIPLRLLSRRPDVVQAEMALAGAYYSVGQARAAFYPSLTLSGSAGWTNSLGQAVQNPGGWLLSALASLTQPLFNRGKLRTNLRVSKDEEQIALLNYKQSLLNAGQEVNNALYACETNNKLIETHRNQCRELERTVFTTESLYRTGNATYLELLTARQSLLSAQL
ncbi:MAG: efflux transporter outer membrane subunit, partial [Candidatus Limisoma sp.]